MKYCWKLVCVALALAGLIGAAYAGEAAQGEPASGEDVYELRCRTCHGATAPADSPIGSSLVGVIGTRAGTEASGVHSRAVIESGIVWDRDKLRRYLSNPQSAIPGTIMSESVPNPDQLERLLDFLESLR